MSVGIVLFAHGSRDPGWTTPFEALARRVRELRPGAEVALAYLEITPPSLGEAVAALVARGATEIAVAPVFLAPGGHVRRDLPQLIDAVRGRHPGLAVRLLPTLGEAPPVTDAIAAWIAAESR